MAGSTERYDIIKGTCFLRIVELPNRTTVVYVEFSVLFRRSRSTDTTAVVVAFTCLASYNPPISPLPRFVFLPLMLLRLDNVLGKPITETTTVAESTTASLDS